MSPLSLIPDPSELDLASVINIYETQRSMMPRHVSGSGRRRPNLIDILEEFDGLILDGYGVINVGIDLVLGIREVLQVATDQNKPVVVLTNASSFDTSEGAVKYHKWQLPITANAIVSSRDALIAALATQDSKLQFDKNILGCLGTTVKPLEREKTLPYDRTPDYWQKVDAFALLGVIDWTNEDQKDFEMALLERSRPVFVSNPDVAAPQINKFSAEPGYWMARAMQTAKFPVQWFGKPYRPAFELALDRMNKLAGREIDRSRVAMIGDSLHTDILGGGAAGLQTVLITGAGLFREGGADHYIKVTGIKPDWIVQKLV